MKDISLMADTDGDGLISFTEYLFFLTLLSSMHVLLQVSPIDTVSSSRKSVRASIQSV